MKGMISLSELFNNKIFRIPDYQRGYAWSDSQLTDFWDDLYNLNGDRYHYTGMLSLKELKSSECRTWDEDTWLLETGYRGYHVVDGQQRLTTCIILLNAILTIAKKNGKKEINEESIDQIKDKFIVKHQKFLKSYLFGYEKDNPSFEYLRYKILGESFPGTIEESFYTLNLQNAKVFFDKKIIELYDEKGFDEVEKLYNKLTTKLIFNIHEIDDDFDVFVAFETMNNRGKKLSNLEILKNRLIYLTTIYPESILSVYEKNRLRKKINETWIEVYAQLGRNKNNPLDDDEFLKNHWTIFYKYTRNQGDDYIQFLLNKQFTPKAIYGERAELAYKNIIDDVEDETEAYESTDVLVPSEIMDYIDSLKDLAKYWYYSFNPSDCKSLTTEEIKWINKLNRIRINYFRTLVVTSLSNNDITSEERIKLYMTIEKFIFVCFRLAKYNTNYDSVNSYKFARELYKKETKVQEIVDFFENEFKKIKVDAINAFQTDVERLFTNYEGFYSWPPKWYFLFEYEAHLSEGRNIAKLDDWNKFTKSEKDHISIEHIYPQKPNAYYWRNNFRKYPSEEEQHRLANSLGNLLALSQSVNSSLQNKEFSLKKKASDGRNGYETGSYSEQEVAKLNDWTPESILERGLHLLDFMEERWGISFANIAQKIACLGLTFLKDNRPDVPEIKDYDFSSRDINYSGVKSEIKVSKYLSNKDLYLIQYYFSIYEKLKEVIPSLYETATKHYISLKCKESSVSLAELHIYNLKKNIAFLTKAPENEDLKIGIQLADNYNWSKSYKVILSDGDNPDKLIEIIKEYYSKLLSGDISPNDDLYQEKVTQQQRTNLYVNCLKKYSSDVEILSSARRYTKFTTPTIKKLFGTLGDGTWGGLSDLVLYGIDNHQSFCKLSLLVGPGESQVRSKVLNFFRHNDYFNVGRGEKWTSVYSIDLLENGIGNESVQKLENFLENIIKEIDMIIELYK